MTTAREYLEAPAKQAIPVPATTDHIGFGVMVALFLAAPFVVYPVFLMKALCFSLFACAFNLLIGYVGLLSFGHAAFLGSAGYATAYARLLWQVEGGL